MEEKTELENQKKYIITFFKDKINCLEEEKQNYKDEIMCLRLEKENLTKTFNEAFDNLEYNNERLIEKLKILEDKFGDMNYNIRNGLDDIEKKCNVKIDNKNTNCLIF